MSTQPTLIEMIDSLVLEKTVSLEALNAINALKAQASELETQLKQADYRLEHQQNTIQELRSEIRTLEGTIASQNTALDQQATRLKSAESIQREGMEAKAELKGFVSAMQMVFRPSVVRESIQKQVPVPVEGNPGGNGYSPTSGYVAQGNVSGVVERSAE